MHCPSCRGALAVDPSSGRFGCDGCGGTWWPMPALDQLLTARGLDLPEPLGPVDAGHAKRPCPACGAAMSVQLAGGELRLPLDVCEAHGVWFDRFEIGPLVDELERETEREAEAKARTKAKAPWWLRAIEAMSGALDRSGEASIRARNRKQYPIGRPPE